MSWKQIRWKGINRESDFFLVKEPSLSSVHNGKKMTHSFICPRSTEIMIEHVDDAWPPLSIFDIESRTSDI